MPSICALLIEWAWLFGLVLDHENFIRENLFLSRI